jgi:parallel beta-helix repeat protein
MNSKTPLVVALAVGFAAAAIPACGSSDNPSAPATGGFGGDASAGGSSGLAGSAGKGGSGAVAGAAGSSGKAGSAGTGGSGGTAGAAGTSGAAGSPGQYGTGTTVQPQYVTTVTGGGATPPSAANGVTASCPGDCSTDATSCLQSAADDAHSQSKTLVIPAPSGACYRITNYVRVYGSVLGVDYPLIKVDGATGDGAHVGIRVSSYAGSGMWLTGLRIDGGWDPTGVTSPAGESSAGIALYDSGNVTIQDNQIQNTAGDSIYLGSDSGTGEPNIIINGNDLVNPYRCNVAFINASGVTVTNNNIRKLNNYVLALDFEPNNPPSEQVLDVEIAGNSTSIPDGSSGCSQCNDFLVGASCSPQVGSPHGGSFFIHDNAVASYMAANVTSGVGPGFASNNSSTWSGSCAAEWNQGKNAHGSGIYVWNNPPSSGTTNGNSPTN